MLPKDAVTKERTSRAFEGKSLSAFESLPRSV
jgi:hypothetical protein